MFGKKKKPVEKAWETTEVFGRQLGDWANEIGSQVQNFAGKAADKAKDYSAQGKKWAEPHINDANKRVHEVSADAQHRWESDILPRLNAAADAARKEAGKNTDLKSKIVAVSGATSQALQTPPKKKRGKKFGWILVTAATAGLGYLVWKRSQPVEDPWAEAYWENIAAEDAAKEAAVAHEEAVVAEEEAAEAIDNAIDENK